MAQVLVRGLDTDVLEKLKARARNNHRSLEAELRLVLARAVETEFASDHGSTADAQARMEQVRALFAGRRFDDSAELLRVDRDR